MIISCVIIKNKLAARCGLIRPDKKSKYFDYKALILISLPLINIVFTLFCSEADFSSIETVDIIKTISSAVLEELLFRGAVLYSLAKELKIGTKGSIYISSILFALAHLLNYSYSCSIIYVIIQTAAAFFIGTCFASIAFESKSIIWTIAIHILINLTGLLLPQVFLPWQYVIYMIIAVLYFYYGIIIFKKGRNDETVY